MSKLKASALCVFLLGTFIACGSGGGDDSASEDVRNTSGQTAATVGSGGKLDQSKLLGRWLFVKHPGNVVAPGELNVAEFRADGSMSINESAIRWKVVGDRLDLEAPRGAVSWMAVLDGDLLRLRDVRGEVTILRRFTGTVDTSGSANTLEVSAFITLLRQGRVQSATAVQSGGTVTIFGRYDRGRYEVTSFGAQQCQELKRVVGGALQDAGIKDEGIPGNDIQC